MMIRKSPEKDDYAKARNTIPMDPTSDIIHIKNIHPTLMEGRLWLAERLGHAITSRRQYLIYRREHQAKLTAVPRLRTDDDAETLCLEPQASTHDNAGSSKTFVGTQYPTPLPQAPKVAATRFVDLSKRTEGSESLLRIPLLPKSSAGVRYKYGDAFECPYCRKPQNVKSNAEWKKHVFSDLRPYVCTFKSCDHDIFQDRNEWSKHELDNHRKQWKCVLCADQELQTLESLGTHFSNLHADLDTETRTAIMTVCLQPWISMLDCPCCYTYGDRFHQRIDELGKWDVSLTQFQQHLGQHMEQLALRALPSNEDKSKNSDDDTFAMKNEDSIYSPLFLKEQLEIVTKILKSEIKRDKIALGHDHPTIYSKMKQLSTIYCRQNKWDESIKLLNELIRKAKVRMGVLHPETQDLQMELAHNYFIKGRSDEAEKLLLEVLEGQKRRFGENQSDIRLTKLMLSRLFLSQGRLDAYSELFDGIKTARKESGVLLHSNKPRPAKKFRKAYRANFR
ncbi:hypothetical protein ACMFMG_009659 [Clarireedia jacksonii]